MNLPPPRVSVTLAIALAVAVAVAVLVVRSDGEDRPSESAYASAGDTDPVNLITEEPTCAPWMSVVEEFTREAAAVNWQGRRADVPASAWTPAERATYDTVGKAMARMADRAPKFAQQTPHRVMREPYEQMVAYTRAFVDRIPTYVPEDNKLLSASSAAGSSISNICGAIAYGTARDVTPLLAAAPFPADPVTPQEYSEPETLVTQSNPACPDWSAEADEFSAKSADWLATSKRVPAAEWTPQQKAVHETVAPMMAANADKLEQLGRQSGDPVLEDVAALQRSTDGPSSSHCPTTRAPTGCWRPRRRNWSG